MSFELLISDYHSQFKEKSALVSEQNNDVMRKLASSLGGTGGIFYVNKTDSTYLNKKHYAGEDFRIKLKVKNWQITTETKFINNYKCFKATSLDTVINTKGTFQFNVTAWFSPDLPSFFGPAGYFGLPGLILELSNGKVVLKAKEINFEKSSETKIKRLKKGILLTQEEFNELVRNTARDLLKQF